MTSTVSVHACCDSNTEVLITISRPDMSDEIKTIQNGAIETVTFYDDMTIIVKEQAKETGDSGPIDVSGAESTD